MPLKLHYTEINNILYFFKKLSLWGGFFYGDNGFATHLLEHDTYLRYILSLLGQANSKTTEIYTHFATKGFDQLNSAMNDLSI